MGMSVIFGMSGTATVKMVAVKDGYQPSDVETYQYFIRVGTPVAFPGDGEWKELSDTVKLSSTTPGATIYYTLDVNTLEELTGLRVSRLGFGRHACGGCRRGPRGGWVGALHPGGIERRWPRLPP